MLQNNLQASKQVRSSALSISRWPPQPSTCLCVLSGESPWPVQVTVTPVPDGLLDRGQSFLPVTVRV